MSTHVSPGAAPAVDAARLIAEVAVLRKQMDARLQAEKDMRAKLAEYGAKTALLAQHGIALDEQAERIGDARRTALGGLLIGTLAMLVAVALTFGWL